MLTEENKKLLDEDDIEQDYYDSDNLYTPLIDNTKIMVYNFRNSVLYYCMFDFTNSLITYFILSNNIKFLYIFYISLPILGYIGSNYCNTLYLSFYNLSIICNIILKFIFFFQFNSIFKIIINIINILSNIWILHLIHKFINLIKKLNNHEITTIINNEYIPEYKINFIYY
tara:strand:+ start:1548 stop:2060 length:513 start_codon:yes stop_codon:yes gene_type:complete